MSKEKCVCGANKPGDGKKCGCLQSRKKYPDSVPKYEGLSRKHYGNYPDKPPVLPEEDYYWESNENSWNYGWNESNKAFTQRQREEMVKGKNGKNK